MFTTAVPIWVSILFLMVIWIPVYLIASLARKGGNAAGKNGKMIFAVIAGFYLLYFGYVIAACFSGAFDKISLPPHILKLTMFPLLAFLVLLIFNLPIFKSILKNIELSDLVRLHIFRLIGSFFLILYFFDALPPLIGILAGTGDVITAVSSIFVANALVQKKAFAKKLTWAWNTFGLLDIMATSASALYLTKVSIETGSQGVEALAAFPFCLIPAFAPATIIFLHLAIYRKLWKAGK